MDSQFVPKINCRFKIRQDLNGFIGYFQGKGVITFNDVGAMIVQQMTGEKNLQEISEFTKKSFPKIKNPEGEVIYIARQLQESGFF